MDAYIKGFLGLSGAILIQIYKTLFNGKPSSFLLMLALLPSLLPLLLMCFVQVHHKSCGDDLRYLNEFSLIALAVAIYLMIVIIGEDFISLKTPVCFTIFLVLLLLVLCPVIVVFRALQSEYKSCSEYSHHARIRLIQDMSSEEHTDQKSSQDPIGFGSGENFNLFQAMSTSEFWLLFLVTACALGSGLATVNNISQIGSSLGYTSMETNTLVSLWSLCNCLGRFGGGYISDYFLRLKGCARPVFISLTLALMSFGHAIISTGLPGSLHVGSMMVGVCYGSQWSLMPAITSELFGLRHFGTIFNAVAIASPVGSYLLSVRVVGFIYDKETSSGMEVCKAREIKHGVPSLRPNHVQENKEAENLH
ncbi:hypothetical protein HPP92_000825 [Vanilla planifolia]|uniref:Nodulin-like domain-containing protein n=1 Tax=Vanilla planifolia TaxID=51239 RepID=A0A835VD00_VANPL|nr:hypothetical protein HPP92_000825 [Vanilla planifolia]